MINVDISNVWGQISLPDLLAMEKEVFAAHMALTDPEGPAGAYLGWQKLPTMIETQEVSRIRATAERIRQSSDAVVVLGVGGGVLAAKAAIELFQGRDYNLQAKPQIFFAGDSLSSRAWNRLEKRLEGKDLSLILVSKYGNDMPSAIATRALRWTMERKYGSDGARKRIFAVTDPQQGALRQLAREEGWESFDIPPTVGDCYGALSPAGLLPMAVAGLDIRAVLRGAWEGKEAYDLRSFENPVWLYSAVRNLMHRKQKAIELLSGFEPEFHGFGAWWQQLFAQSEGKEGKGLFPVPVCYPADLYALGQTLQEGQRNLFETLVRFDPPARGHIIASDHKNLDGLNFLSGMTLDEVQEQACQGILSAHVDGDVPVLTVDMGELTEEKLGEMFWFFQLGCAISGLLLGVNPFTQPGMEPYRDNLSSFLSRPGWEM